MVGGGGGGGDGVCFAGTRLQSRGRGIGRRRRVVGGNWDEGAASGCQGVALVKRWSRRANLSAEGQLYSFTKEVNSEKKEKTVK